MMIIIALTFPTLTLVNASMDNSHVKAAFIREGNLWTLIDHKEKQITKSGKVYGSPQWSHDGKYLLYQKETSSEFQNSKTQSEIWVYQITSGEKRKIYYDGHAPKWAPDQNIISFQSDGVLNVSDLDRFYNAAMGVYGYTWLPDGSGFLLASRADLLPDGWTNPKLYKKTFKKPYSEMTLMEAVEDFFTIPKEIEVDNHTIMSINARHFTFSPSGKWISFIVSPTASLSMDSNALAVISSDGEKFTGLDELILGVGLPKWAPTKDIIAYIAGGGRLVAGFKDKDLKVKEMPVSGSLTPENYAELDFTWVDNESLITARIQEKEWSNDFSKHPLPSLYAIHIINNKQTKITNPPEDFGDYDPQYIKSVDKLVWLRGKSLTDNDKNLWLAESDGSDAEKWLQNVETIAFYE